MWIYTGLCGLVIAPNQQSLTDSMPSITVLGRPCKQKILEEGVILRFSPWGLLQN